MNSVEPESLHKKRRTKTFTGCRTCRDRHVKCDEGRPFCARCTKSKIRCDGYGKRLTWAKIRGPTSFHLQKNAPQPDQRLERRVPLISNPPPPAELTPPPPRSSPPPPESSPPPSPWPGEVADDRDWPTGGLLPDLECIANANNSVSRDSNASVSRRTQPRAGVTGVEAVISGVPAPFSGPETLEGLSTALPSGYPCNSCTDQFQSWQSFDDSLHHHLTAATEELDITAENFSHAAMSPQCHYQSFLPANQPHGQFPCPQFASRSLKRASGTKHGSLSSSAIPRHLDAMPDLPLHRQLLEHWYLHLADTLLPIHTLNSPFRCIVTPIAYAGALASSGSSSPSIAVFHLICSASASDLADRRGQSNYSDLSLQHHRLGMQHLRQNITTDDPEDYTTLMAAFCMCLLNETLTVGTPFWRIHARGACAWFNRIEPAFWSGSGSQSVLYQLFFGLVFMINLQLAGDAEEPIEPPTIAYLVPKEFYCMDQLYGLCQTTLEALLKVTKIKRLHSISELSTSEELDILEIELYLSCPPASLQMSTTEISLAIHHHSHAFHYTCILYYKRSLRHVPVADVQHLVSKTLDHFEALLLATTRPFSPSVWPMAIMAFEASEKTLQRRVLAVLDRIFEMCRFNIWRSLKALALSIWETRQRDDTDISIRDLTWEHFLSQNKEFSILLV